MSEQLLNPNQQLWLILGIFIFIAMLIGFAHALLRRQLNDVLRLQGGAVTPLWKAALQAAQAILTHPHEFAEEADELMREAAIELETRQPMPG